MRVNFVLNLTFRFQPDWLPNKVCVSLAMTESHWATQAGTDPLTWRLRLSGEEAIPKRPFLLSFEMEFLTLPGGIWHSLSNTSITGLQASAFQIGWLYSISHRHCPVYPWPTKLWPPSSL